MSDLRKGSLVSIVIVAAAMVMAACSSTSTSSSSTTATTAMSTTTKAPATSTTAAQNFTLSATTSAELLKALAIACHASPGDFSGFAPGTSYFAIDNATGTFWAAGQAVPTAAAAGGNAGVCVQDQGSYWIFYNLLGTTTWVPERAGYVGPGSGGTCPAQVPPAAVTNAWGWPAGACRPASNP
jgi:hypothetical protein